MKHSLFLGYALSLFVYGCGPCWGEYLSIQTHPTPTSPDISPTPPSSLPNADYYLHLCERGRQASSAIRQEGSRTVVFGSCRNQNDQIHQAGRIDQTGQTQNATLLFRLACTPPLKPGIAVPYTGASYEVILKTCGDTLYGINAAGPLRAYAEAYQLAFTWENLQTVRKFSVIAYLDHLKVKLLSTSGILQRIWGLNSPHTQKPLEVFKREEELAHAIHEMYTLAFRILGENTG